MNFASSIERARRPISETIAGVVNHFCKVPTSLPESPVKIVIPQEYCSMSSAISPFSQRLGAPFAFVATGTRTDRIECPQQSSCWGCTWDRRKPQRSRPEGSWRAAGWPTFPFALIRRSFFKIGNNPAIMVQTVTIIPFFA